MVAVDYGRQCDQYAWIARTSSAYRTAFIKLAKIHQSTRRIRWALLFAIARSQSTPGVAESRPQRRRKSLTEKWRTEVKENVRRLVVDFSASPTVSVSFPSA